MPKSTSNLPGAASTQRAALAAINDWKCKMLMRRDSTSCACGNGAVTRKIGERPVSDVTIEEPTLEEIFMHYYE